MGLCASQARLLMLTARKSDLEYRRMQITNAKQLLAMEQEEIAMERSEKLSNMQFTNMYSGEALNATGLLDYIQGQFSGAEFRIDEKLFEKMYGSTFDSTRDYNNDGTVDNKDMAVFLDQLTEAELYEAYEMGIVSVVDTTNNDALISLTTENGIKEKRYEDDDALSEARYTEAMAKVKRKEQ